VEKLDHRRKRNKKTVWYNPQYVEYKRSDSPHGAEQKPNKRDDEERENVQQNPHGGGKSMIIRQHT